MEFDNPLHPHPQEMTTDPPFGIRMRFAQCPPGLTCPHVECTFPHCDSPIRLTRHWRYANHHNCNFVHNRSISRLNTHLQNCHNGTPLPTQHHLPYNLRPCFDCNMIIDHRSLVSHRHNCPASSGRHSTTSTRQNAQGYTPPITSFFRRDDSDSDPTTMATSLPESTTSINQRQASPIPAPTGGNHQSQDRGTSSNSQNLASESSAHQPHPQDAQIPNPPRWRRVSPTTPQQNSQPTQSIHQTQGTHIQQSAPMTQSQTSTPPRREQSDHTIPREHQRAQI